MWNAEGIPADFRVRIMSSYYTDKGYYIYMEVLKMYFETIAKVIAERMDIDVESIKPESTFADLKIDSLDTVDMVMNLEDILGIEIDLDQPVATVDTPSSMASAITRPKPSLRCRLRKTLQQAISAFSRGFGIRSVTR